MQDMALPSFSWPGTTPKSKCGALSKASIIIDQSTGVILGALNFTETLHDSKTIPEALEQYERLNGTLPKEVFVDRDLQR